MMDRSIMSGDSPNAHKNDMFEFSRDVAGGRTSPIPTTSKDVGVQFTNTPNVASVSIEPEKKIKEEEPLDICCPILNQDEEDAKPHEEDETMKPDKPDADDDKKDKKANGGDKLDGVWIPPHDRKNFEPEEEDDDNCAVKCLYYTLQCCECSIM